MPIPPVLGGVSPLAAWALAGALRQGAKWLASLGSAALRLVGGSSLKGTTDAKATSLPSPRALVNYLPDSSVPGLCWELWRK